MSKKNTLLFFLLLLSSVFSFAFAQTSAGTTTVVEEEEEEYEFPQSGRLAGKVSGGLKMDALGPWMGKQKDKGAGSSEKPLTASINKANGRWVVRVLNKSEDYYTASLKVVQIDSAGRNIRTNPFSVSLRAGQSVERTFVSSPRTSTAAVDLVRWTVKKKEKPKKEEDSEELEAESAGTAESGLRAGGAGVPAN